MDLWSLLGYQLIALLAGAATGGLALLLGGAGSMRVLANRLDVLEERQDHTADRITTEVKKRASAAGVAKREQAASVEEEAKQLLELAGNGPHGLQLAPKAAERPSVIGLKPLDPTLR